MVRKSSSRDPWRILAIAALGLSILFVAAATVVYINRPAPADQVSIRELSTDTTTTPEDNVVDISTVRHAVFIGDSWTRGAWADPEEAGFAYLTAAKLGVAPVVYGFGGAGYLNPGNTGEGTFSQRIAAMEIPTVPDLIVVEGSLNDRDFTPNEIKAAAGAFIDELHARFPAAQIAMMGPDISIPGLRASLRGVNWAVREVATERDLKFVNPLAERWFDERNLDVYMDPKNNNPHPSTAGHAYIADRLFAELRGEEWAGD